MKKKSAHSDKRASVAARYLAKLKSFYFRNKRMPSYGEIATALGFKSRYAALYRANKWIEEGIISRDSAGKLLPGKLFYPLKVLGVVKAGWPSPAEEENIDTISLDDWLIENREGSYMLKVSGDSMMDAGIMPGDMVIINRARQAKNGDIVVAEVDGAWTVKRLQRRSGGQVVLLAANKKYSPIVPREELKIAGVVRAVVRKY
jgi:repressor LexA